MNDVNGLPISLPGGEGRQPLAVIPSGQWEAEG